VRARVRDRSLGRGDDRGVRSGCRDHRSEADDVDAGGRAWRRPSVPARRTGTALSGPGAYSVACNSLTNSSASVPRKNRHRPPGQRYVKVLPDLHLQLATVEQPPSRASPPPCRTWLTAAPVAPVPLARVSPTPRSKIRARIPPSRQRRVPGDVGAVGKQLVTLDAGAERRKVEFLELGLPGNPDRALGISTDTCWKRQVRPPLVSIPGTVLGSRRVVVTLQPHPPEVEATQVVGEVIRGPDLAARAGLDREAVGGRPAGAAKGRGPLSRVPLPDSSASESVGN